MNKSIAALLALAVAAPTAFAQEGQNKVAVHGSVQVDGLVPESDVKIGTEEYSDKVLGNIYANAGVYSKYVDGGFRVEYLEHPMPGFEKPFAGWGLANIYVKGKYKGFELTAGDFYEQFGSGFILRTYEERSLGVDNSIRGGRLKVNALKGFRFTALGGVQRDYWNWNTHSSVYGADVEFDINDYSHALRDNGITWTLGGSYVLKHEDNETKVVSGNYALNLPKNVSAFDFRTNFYKGGFGVLLEYAWKSQDPSFVNNYTYGRGNAIMLSTTYSKTGMSAMLQAKRSYNMAFRSRRSEQNLIPAYINNMPAFTYQHTYSLAAMYPYATQAAPGEWAFQGSFAYKFKKGTALGGRYGTKITFNGSYICGLGKKEIPLDQTPHNSLWGTDWFESGNGGLKDIYYTDLNLQLDKKFSKVFSFNFMYMFQKYNKTVIEGHGGMINSNIFVAEGKFKFDRRFTLRTEAQWLQTRDDKRDWVYGLAELSIAPYVMIAVSDQWNCGNPDPDQRYHYYMFSATGTYKGNRLMIGYGRTRAGYNCSGGVCRYVPASRGFQVSYNYNF